MEILVDATNVIAEGEVLQLLNMHDPDVDEARYLQVIRYKTAKLFEAAAQLGAVLAGADADDRSGARPSTAGASAPRSRSSTTCSTTRATAESMGKNVGDDLREGKPTLPLIYRDGTRHGGTERALVRDAIEHGGTDDFDDDLRGDHARPARSTTRAKRARRSRQRPRMQFLSSAQIPFTTRAC